MLLSSVSLTTMGRGVAFGERLRVLQSIHCAAILKNRHFIRLKKTVKRTAKTEYASIDHAIGMVG